MSPSDLTPFPYPGIIGQTRHPLEGPDTSWLLEGTWDKRQSNKETDKHWWKHFHPANSFSCIARSVWVYLHVIPVRTVKALPTRPGELFKSNCLRSTNHADRHLRKMHLFPRASWIIYFILLTSMCVCLLHYCNNTICVQKVIGICSLLDILTD